MTAERLSKQNAWTEGDAQSQRLYDAVHVFDKLTLLIQQRTRAQQWVRGNPFYLAASLSNPRGDKRVYWLSAGDDPSLLADYNVTGAWTPIGRTILRIKDAIKDGRSLGLIDASHAAWVRVPAGYRWEPNGPVIDFNMKAGATRAEILQAVLWDVIADKGVCEPLGPPTLGKPQPEIVTPEGVPALRIVRTGYGLGDVVASLDTYQLANIDFQEDGPLFVTGAAGTGKTTVAFYRAAYLMEEQRAALKAEPNVAPFFALDKMLVLVRREHLKPYLGRLAHEVGIAGIPVKTFDEWFQQAVFTPYLRRPQVRFALDPDPVLERWCAVFNETHVREYLESSVRARFEPLHRLLSNAFTELKNILDSLPIPSKIGTARVETLQHLRQAWSSDLARLGAPKWLFARDAIDYFSRSKSTLERIRAGSADYTDVPEWQTFAQKALPQAEGTTQDVQRRTISQGFRFDQLTKDFYATSTARKALEDAFVDSAKDAAAILSDYRRPFSRADDVVACWLVEWLTEGVNGGPQHLQPLDRYDHVILDEAQFYPTAVIRLLRRLARAPRRAFTAVGDLEQRSAASGLTDWRDIVTPSEADRIKRLDRIYRASREIYEFLLDLNTRLGLNSHLVPPREVDRFAGQHPRMVVTGTEADELRWLVGAIEEQRRGNRQSAIAIILPEQPTTAAIAERIGTELNGFGLPTRVAYGEDIGERLDKILITNADSVVGLEFDAVFIPMIAKLWPSDMADLASRRAFWVCASRAKSCLALSSHMSFPQWLEGAPIGGVAIERISAIDM